MVKCVCEKSQDCPKNISGTPHFPRPPKTTHYIYKYKLDPNTQFVIKLRLLDEAQLYTLTKTNCF